MKLKLNIKILALTIIVIFCTFFSMLILIYLANKTFVKYTQTKELDKMSYLIESLGDYYRRNNGWNGLEKREVWLELLEAALSKDYFNPSSNKINFEKPQTDRIVIITLALDKVSLSNPIWDPLGLGNRIGLYDENKKYIAGQKNQSLKKCSLIQIEFKNKIVGWLTLSEDKKNYQPLDIAFLENQSTFFLIMGSSFLFILIVIFLLFSKYILKPITRLAEATKQVGNINFSFHVPVESSDELGELAANFNDMAKKLATYERERQQWLADISHELRTPLSALICEIDALKDGIRKPNKMSLRCLSNEVKHLIQLVNDIQDISFIEAGIFSSKKELLKPLPLLSQEIYIFDERFNKNNISLEVDFDPLAADLQIMGDPNRIMQLFSNIFENAIRYTTKPCKLIVKQNYKKDWIKFIIEDSGPGVPDEALPLLFDRLYRIEKSRNRKTGGSGLGLAICKSIVEMHNGSIRALNVQDGGLMIEIVLPLEPCFSDSINPKQLVK